MAPPADEQELKTDRLYHERTTKWCGVECPDIQLTPEYPQVGPGTDKHLNGWRRYRCLQRSTCKSTRVLAQCALL